MCCTICFGVKLNAQGIVYLSGFVHCPNLQVRAMHTLLVAYDSGTASSGVENDEDT
jgi:hypothetical protein